MKSTIQLSTAMCSILLPAICGDCFNAIDEDDMMLLRIMANMLSYSHEQYIQQTVSDMWATITFTKQDSLLDNNIETN